jgi:hypothetical protein
MRALVIAVAVAALTACQSRPPALWQQTGKTADETKADEAACLQQIERASDGKHSAVTPSDAMADCMDGKGYHQDRWNRFACCRRLLGS